MTVPLHLSPIILIADSLPACLSIFFVAVGNGLDRSVLFVAADNNC